MRLNLDVAAGRDGGFEYFVLRHDQQLGAYVLSAWDLDSLKEVLEHASSKLKTKGWHQKTNWQYDLTSGEFFCLVDEPT